MSASQLEKASKTLLCVDPGFFYRDSITQMCVYSAKIETLAALPKGGVILTSQFQCLNEARRLGKAGVHSGDCKEGCSWLSHQLGRTADLKCLPSASKWPGGSSDRTTSAAAVKSLQSCPTPCDAIDGSPPGSSVPRILQARILEWVAISFSNACMHAKSLHSCPTLCNPRDGSPPGSSVHRIL